MKFEPTSGALGFKNKYSTSNKLLNVKVKTKIAYKCYPHSLDSHSY